MTELAQTFAAAAGGLARLEQNFNARSFHPERRARQAVDEAAAYTLEAYEKIDAVARRLKFADVDQVEALKAEWLGRFRGAWTAYQAAGARCANWAITGPSNFPVRRNQKRLDTEHRRMTEMLEIANGAARWAEKRIKRAIAEQLGPVGVADKERELARANLAQRERRQAMMKATNAAIRRHKAKGEAAAPAIAAELAPLGFVEISPAIAAKLLEPDYCGRIGFAAYQLSNNNAEIKRMQGRVAVLERRAAAVHAADQAPAVEPLELDDDDAPRLVENALEQRVQLMFPGKPSAAIRDRLKGRGFRWSPRHGAWQRQLTANGIHAAREILGAIQQEAQ